MSIFIAHHSQHIDWLSQKFEEGPHQATPGLVNETFKHLWASNEKWPNTPPKDPTLMPPPLKDLRNFLSQLTGENLDLQLANVTRQQAGCGGRGTHFDNRDDDRKHWKRSALLYLSDDFEGGDLYVGDRPDVNAFRILKPWRGLLVTFPENMNHGTTLISNGTRLRLDIFFSWFPPTLIE